jgi:hypothetical protein
VTRRILPAAFLALLSACAGLGGAGGSGGGAIRGAPGTRAGWLLYDVQGLHLEAPSAWEAGGDPRRLSLAAPDGRARLEVSVPEPAYRDERDCLAAAEQRLAGGAGGLERARRHPSRLAGRPAQALEGDQGGWHVWALAVCDGATQYRVFFTAATPATPEAIDVWRTLMQAARIGGEA